MRRTTVILGGNRAAGKVKCTPVGFIPVAVWSLLSLEVGKVQNAPLEIEGSTNPKSRKNTGLWRNSWLPGRNSTKPMQELPGQRAKKVMIPLPIFSSLKKRYFLPIAWMCTWKKKGYAKCHLISWQESSWQWICSHLCNLASSYGSPVAQTHVSMRVHASLETIPSPNPQLWQQGCSDI